jgi:hypothetical protein
MLLLHRKWMDVIMVAAAQEEMQRRLADVKAAEAAEAERLRKMMEKKSNPEAEKRWGLCWRMVKVWLKLIYIPRRRHESIKKVRNFLDGLTESARVKVSVMRFKKRVLKMQWLARDFNERKRVRMVELIHQWQHCEDRYLERTFQENTARMREDNKERAKEEAKHKGAVAAKRASALNDDFSRMPANPHMWKQWRMSAEVREQALMREYMGRLQAYVRACDVWKQKMIDSKNQKQELRDFLKVMGSEPKMDDLESVFPFPDVPKNFNSVSDEDMEEVIVKVHEEQRAMKQEQRKKAEEKRRKLHGAPRSRESKLVMAEFAAKTAATLMKGVEDKEDKDFTFDALFKDLSPRVARIMDDPDKEGEHSEALKILMKGKVRPAVALELATAAVGSAT